MNLDAYVHNWTHMHDKSVHKSTTQTTQTPSDLLYGGQALQMGCVLVLLQGCCLQHEVLLLGCVHLMQVLGCHGLRSVDGLLDHLLESHNNHSKPIMQLQSIKTQATIPYSLH